MSNRALAAPQQRAGQAQPAATGQQKAVSLGVALRYLAVRRAKTIDPRPPVQRPVLRIVT